MIELSIVLVIIGLLAGGILVGRDLIQAANTRALISQMEKYRTAIRTFQTKYNALPGDITAANAAAFALTPRDGSTGNGDGNGYIESCPNGDNGTVNYVELGCENALVWNDLSSGQLIDGSFTTATGGTLANTISAAQVPLYLPKAKGIDGNAYLFIYSQHINTSDTFTLNSNTLVVSGIKGTLDANGLISQANMLTPLMVYNIDNKIDDGIPYSGQMHGYSANTGMGFWGSFIAANACATDTQHYNLAPPYDNQPLCTLLNAF